MEISGNLHSLAAVHLGKEPQEPIGGEVEGATELVWLWWRREKVLHLPGIKPR
jgi:hypothetical protein